jgi:signal transduction histidine kinase
VASGLLAVLIGVAFGVLLWAIDDANDSASARRASRTALVEAGTMEQLVLDIETGQRGFVITKREQFLQPWEEARKSFPVEARRFNDSATSPAQHRAAARITEGVRSFVNDYSVPLVQAVRRGDPAASGLAETVEGKRRVDALRAQFGRYTADERAQLAARERAAGAHGQRAVIAAGVGLGVSIVLVTGFTVLQHRAVVRPVRGVADAAQRFAAGDPGVRVRPSRVAEIGALGASFNSMAASLQDSRRRVMESVEEVHRRTARDLHDGAQQRLVSLMIGLRLARETVSDQDTSVIELLEDSIGNAQTAIDELRELARGIYPLSLTVKGIAGAVEELAARCPVPVDVEDKVDRRIASAVESNAYFIGAEAVTNAVKHARASRITVSLDLTDVLHIRVSDDGIGGVVETKAGSGLTGLIDRVSAFDGTLAIDSPPGVGTTVTVRIPMPA